MESMMLKRATLAAGAVLTLAATAHFSPVDAQAPGSKASQPPAQQSQSLPAAGGAEMTTATYGDWQLRCRMAPAGGARSCEVVQSVIIQGQSAPFAQIAFGKVSPSEPLVLTAVLPINIAFPSTVKITLDEKDKQPFELAWTRCMPGGCFASSPAKDDALKRLRSQDEGGRFSFRNSAGQDVTLPFSLRGLARALDALAKEG